MEKDENCDPNVNFDGSVASELAGNLRNKDYLNHHIIINSLLTSPPLLMLLKETRKAATETVPINCVEKDSNKIYKEDQKS